jgi:hypothetical protein
MGQEGGAVPQMSLVTRERVTVMGLKMEVSMMDMMGAKAP